MSRFDRSTQQNADQDPDGSYEPLSDLILSPMSSQVGPCRIPAIEQDFLLDHTPLEQSVALPLSDDEIRSARDMARLSVPCFGLCLTKYGYGGVVDTAYRESKRSRHAFHAGKEYSSLTLWRVAGPCLLSDVPMCILQALLDGDLASKVIAGAPEDAELCRHFDDDDYWMVRNGGGFAPVHYVRIFADAAGKPPSPAQLYTVVDILEKYASGKREHDQLCADVDGQIPRGSSTAASIQQGLHRWFDGNAARVTMLLTFAAALKAYLDKIPQHSRDQPIPDSLKYVGFSIVEKSRTSSHNTGTTSWLMALFFCACKLSFHNAGRALFEFSTYIVAYPITRDECKLGEELFCRMCKSYYQGGLGFNIQHAGLSVAGINMDGLSHNVALALWQQREDLRDQSPVSNDQMLADCRDKLPKWLEVLEYYNKTPEQHKQDQIAIAEAGIAKHENARPTLAGVREVVAQMHREAEREVREGLSHA
jgi:hypothetical protein